MKAEDIFNIIHCAQSDGKSVKIKYLYMFVIPLEIVVEPQYVITDINKDHIIAGKSPIMIKLGKIKKVSIV